jgi:hypothetical protein
MFRLDKSSFWVMLLLDAYAVACIVTLLFLLVDLKTPLLFTLTHN